MTKTLRYLTVTTLSVSLAAGIAWAGKGGGKPGGGGSGGGDTSTVPVEAHFIGDLSDNGGTYDGSTVPGGRVELPATGNFTMDLKGSGRALNVVWGDYIVLWSDSPPQIFPKNLRFS